MREVTHDFFFVFRESGDLRDTDVMDDIANKPDDEEVVVRGSVLHESVFFVPWVKFDKVVKTHEICDRRSFEPERKNHVSSCVFETFIREVVFFESIDEDNDEFLREVE